MLRATTKLDEFESGEGFVRRTESRNLTLVYHIYNYSKSPLSFLGFSNSDFGFRNSESTRKFAETMHTQTANHANNKVNHKQRMPTGNRQQEKHVNRKSPTRQACQQKVANKPSMPTAPNTSESRLPKINEENVTKRGHCFKCG